MLLSSGHASTLTLLVFMLSDALVFSDWLVQRESKTFGNTHMSGLESATRLLTVFPLVENQYLE